MSSQPSVQWFYSKAEGRRYYLSASERCYRWEDGTRVISDQSGTRLDTASQTNNQQTPSVQSTSTPRTVPVVPVRTGASSASSPPANYQLSSGSSLASNQRVSSGPAAQGRPSTTVSAPQQQPRPSANQPDPSYPARGSIGNFTTSSTASSPTYASPALAASSTSSAPAGQSRFVGTRPYDPATANTSTSLSALPSGSSIARPPGAATTNTYGASTANPYGQYGLFTTNQYRPSNPYPSVNPTSQPKYTGSVSAAAAVSQPGPGSTSALSGALRNAHLSPTSASQPTQQGPQPTSNVQPRTGQDSNGVRYHIVDGPPDNTTDPELRRALGVRAHAFVRGTAGENEVLDDSYRVRKHASKFFVRGKVFLVLWSEPANADSDAGTDVARTEISRDSRFSQPIHTKVRRFVVIRESDKYCTAIPILTHGNQGVAKRGVKKSDFAIIHTGRTPPDILPGEHPLRGEAPMRPSAIRVDPDERGAKLVQYSRCNFGKVYTVEHNVKVKPWGMVNRDSMQALVYQFRDVWMDMFGVPVATNTSQAPAQAPVVASSSSGQTRSGAPRDQPRPDYTREQLRGMAQRSSTQPSTTTRSQSRSTRSHTSEAIARQQSVPEEDPESQSSSEGDDE